MSSTVNVKIEDLIKPYIVDGRVDVARLATEKGIKIYPKDNLKDSGSIKYDKDTDSFEIWLNTSEPATRQRFTIAHEFSHYLLHEDKIREKGGMDRASETVYSDEERDADALASEILMPGSLVKSFLDSKKLSDKLRLPGTIATIADQFRVSKTTVVQRLRELKYNVPFISFA